ncbi:helix-turn-helix domain-containing protein [Propionivibrio limicola]|uniref:helix-turn-helix domain-containing protein n=1 Tax=Propionivibrio limicola TaxID=167645 RepID=UPI001291C6D3|nr:AraC family transcriptional regulator [Propionivibrio limicola]
MTVKESTEIATASAVAKDEKQAPLLILPANWGGLPLNIYPLPSNEERGASHAVDPMLFLVLSGHSQRCYRYNTNIINLETKPGGIELKGHDYQREWARWDGTPGLTAGVKFTPSIVERLVKGVSDFDVATTFEFFDPKIEWFMHELLSEAQRGAPEGPLYAESLSCALIAYLGREHGHRKDYGQPSGGLSPVNRQRMIDYIEAHLGDELSVTVMAEEVGLSPHHFARCFTASFGTPPHRYILQRRIEAARKQLTLSSRTLADIALDLGFYSHTHFSRVFRQHTGVNPSSLRRRNCCEESPEDVFPQGAIQFQK